jgi:hypothetical protein
MSSAIQSPHPKRWGDSRPDPRASGGRAHNYEHIERTEDRGDCRRNRQVDLPKEVLPHPDVCAIGRKEIGHFAPSETH